MRKPYVYKVRFGHSAGWWIVLVDFSPLPGAREFHDFPTWHEAITYALSLSEAVSQP